MDPCHNLLLDALKQGVAQPGEHRLYRSGKLAGLFPGRTGAAGEAAARALRDGLVGVARTETRGKTTTEWVKVTPKGIEFVLQNESPVRALDELRDVLQKNQDGIPHWLADMKQAIDRLTRTLTEEVQALSHRLDALMDRVQGALMRVDRGGPPLPEGAATSLPWAQDLVGYLARRREGGLGDKCPLPELFAALKEKEADLTIKDFHLGLRRLHDHGTLRLLPFESPEGPPEPEYALLDGPAVYYYAAR